MFESDLQIPVDRFMFESDRNPWPWSWRRYLSRIQSYREKKKTKMEHDPGIKSLLSDEWHNVASFSLFFVVANTDSSQGSNGVHHGVNTRTFWMAALSTGDTPFMQSLSTILCAHSSALTIWHWSLSTLYFRRVTQALYMNINYAVCSSTRLRF
jgi:hypothetical protein